MAKLDRLKIWRSDMTQAIYAGYVDQARPNMALQKVDITEQINDLFAKDFDEIGERNWALSVLLAFVDLAEIRRIGRTLSDADRLRFNAVLDGFKRDIAARDAKTVKVAAPSVSDTAQ